MMRANRTARATATDSPILGDSSSVIPPCRRSSEAAQKEEADSIFETENTSFSRDLVFVNTALRHTPMRYPDVTILYQLNIPSHHFQHFVDTVNGAPPALLHPPRLVWVWLVSTARESTTVPSQTKSKRRLETTDFDSIADPSSRSPAPR